MMNNCLFLYFFILINYLQCSYSNAPHSQAQLKYGSDVFMEKYIHQLKGKRVGLITNHTAVNRQGHHIADLLHRAGDIHLVALFGPEHGIRGAVEAGFHVNADTDEATGVPIFSLYGETRKPTPDMLKDIDVLIFDIQDIGTRFYTYISTMALAMEAAAEKRISFIVFDRPNPINGRIVEGPVLEDGYQSFVGIHPIALRHGMTVGELARLFNEEGYLPNHLKAELMIMPVENWKRTDSIDASVQHWIKPSPNITDIETAFLYPGMGLLEATNISEGRGTPLPFKNIGAPWVDNITLSGELKKINLPGVHFDTASFIPVDLPGIAMDPKYNGENCKGLRFHVSDQDQFQSVALGIHLICIFKKLHPDQFRWRSQRSIDIMAGTDKFRLAVDSGQSADQIIEMLQTDVDRFKSVRQKYLLYQ